MGDASVLVDHDGSVARVTLNRPDRRNALSLELLDDLLAAFRSVPATAGVVVLDAAGPVFSAGHDLSEMVGRDPAFYDELFERCTQVMLALHELAQPVIARVHGAATAAGCQLVASCDLAVAADHAWFATPGVKIGLFCSTPMVPVARLIGQRRALQMLFTGEPIDAATALDWGLVNSVVPAAELDEAVDALATKILQFSPRVLSLGKRTFYAQVGQAEPDAYATVTPVMSANAGDGDAQEGFAAFLAKRDPNWSR